jgi:hypothetical protein
MRRRKKKDHVIHHILILSSSYPSTCIPSPLPNLSCNDVGVSNFEARSPDPQGFDDNNDGIGCENGNTERPELDGEPAGSELTDPQA